MKTPLSYEPGQVGAGGFSFSTGARGADVRQPFGEFQLTPNQPHAGAPLHEIHHWIANHEGFAQGTAGLPPPPTAPTYPVYQRYVNETFNLLDKPPSDPAEFADKIGLLAERDPAGTRKIFDQLPTMGPERKASLAQSIGNWNYYNSTLGEAHARNVANRHLDPSLYSIPHWQTYDVPKLTLPPYADGGRVGFQGGGGLEGEEEELQRQREIGTASGSDLGPTSPVRSPGLLGGARPVQPTAQFGAPATTEPEIAPAPAPTPIARDLNPLGFYSHGADVAANLLAAAGHDAAMVAAIAERGASSRSELKAAGLDDLSDMPPTTSREELAGFSSGPQPPLQETQLEAHADRDRAALQNSNNTPCPAGRTTAKC